MGVSPLPSPDARNAAATQARASAGATSGGPGRGGDGGASALWTASRGSAPAVRAMRSAIRVASVGHEDGCMGRAPYQSAYRRTRCPRRTIRACFRASDPGARSGRDNAHVSADSQDRRTRLRVQSASAIRPASHRASVLPARIPGALTRAQAALPEVDTNVETPSPCAMICFPPPSGVMTTTDVAG